MTENINRYLNNNLKRAKCSKSLFRECILNIILQFSNKVINESLEKNKTELLKFYVNKKGKIDLLTIDEIKKLKQEYDDINFININEKYSDELNGEPDLINSDNENDDN